MPRIAGVDVPAAKRIDIALQYIYGIGSTRSREILKKAQIDPALRANKLSEEEVSRIAGIISPAVTSLSFGIKANTMGQKGCEPLPGYLNRRRNTPSLVMRQFHKNSVPKSILQ